MTFAISIIWLQKPTVYFKLILAANKEVFELFFSRKVIGGSDKHQSVGHVARGGILTNFSSTVISCVSCPRFSASFDVDVLVDLKAIR